MSDDKFDQFLKENKPSSPKGSPYEYKLIQERIKKETTVETPDNLEGKWAAGITLAIVLFMSVWWNRPQLMNVNPEKFAKKVVSEESYAVAALDKGQDEVDDILEEDDWDQDIVDDWLDLADSV